MPKVPAAGYCPEARPTESGALVLRAGQAYSFTSSARASSDLGMSMPSALAVFRFITSSCLVGACTGKLAGFSPLSMRSARVRYPICETR